MATAGYTSIGANNEQVGTANGTNNPAGLLITMPVAGSISKITAYVNTTISGVPSGSGSTTCSIYAGTSGSLGSLLSSTNSNTFNGTAAFVDFTFASAYSASATTYWIEFTGLGGGGGGTAVGNIKYDTGGGANTSYLKNDVGTPAYGTNQYSLYATYTASGGSTGFVIALK